MEQVVSPDKATVHVADAVNDTKQDRRHGRGVTQPPEDSQDTLAASEYYYAM